jgi:hypothetical protein
VASKKQAVRSLKVYQAKFRGLGRSKRQLGHRVFDGFRILHPFRGIEDFHADDVSILVIVQNDAGFVLVALLDLGITEFDREYVHFLIVFHLHSFLQYLLIVLVRYMVTTTA